MQRAHKYGAKATTVDGIRFASHKEARRYQELKLLEKARELEILDLQPAFQLKVQPDETWRIDQQVAIGEYRADFAYLDFKTGAVVYEDVKGFKTALYKWKKRHVEAQYGIEIREV